MLKYHRIIRFSTLKLDMDKERTVPDKLINIMLEINNNSNGYVIQI